MSPTSLGSTDGANETVATWPSENGRAYHVSGWWFGQRGLAAWESHASSCVRRALDRREPKVGSVGTLVQLRAGPVGMSRMHLD